MKQVSVTAQFFARRGVFDYWFLDERTVQSSQGKFRFDNVPMPTMVDLQIWDGQWLLARITRDGDFFSSAAGGEANRDGESQSGSSKIAYSIDFGRAGQPRLRLDTGNYIPIWDSSIADSIVPNTSDTVDGCRVFAPSEKYEGEISNTLAYQKGDEVDLRVKNLPVRQQFEVWQSEVLIGSKGECTLNTLRAKGKRLATVDSNEHGMIKSHIVLDDIEHQGPTPRTSIWLVDKTGRADSVVQWTNYVPAKFHGILFDTRGHQFADNVEVKIRASLEDRTIQSSTVARNGEFLLENIPIPSDIEISVYQGKRRLARRRIRKSDASLALDGSFLPKMGKQVEISFGGTGKNFDQDGQKYPLFLK